MNSVSLQNLHLEIDYLTFNINSRNPEYIQKIALYLARSFGCYSIFINHKTKEKKVLQKPTNFNFRAEFREEEVEYWAGTALKISGRNASIFYDLIKEKTFDLDVFSLQDISLGRIDLAYDVPISQRDISVRSFLAESYQQHNKKKPKTTVDFHRQRLTIGERKHSSSFFRAYLKKNGRDFRLEFEFKREKAKAFQHALFYKKFDDFENGLAYLFFQKICRIFDLSHPYMASIQSNFRKVRQLQFNNLRGNNLLTSYMIQEPIYENSNLPDFYKFLQLLNYIRTLRYVNEVLAFGNVRYRSYKFPLHDFLEVLCKSKTNYYQLQKLRAFFNLFKRKDIIPDFVEYFSDTEFQRIAVMPVFKVQKTGTTWEVILTISEDFFKYLYPYCFSEAFFNYGNKHELQAQIFLMQAYTQMNFEKQLLVEEFFIKTKLNNHNKLKIRKHLVFLFNDLQKSKLIDKNITLITKNGKKKTVKQLTSNLISRSKYINFNEKFGI